MKAVFVTNSLTGGGAERSVNMIVNELYARNMDVVLVPINKSLNDLVEVLPPIETVERILGDGVINTIKSIIRFNTCLRRLNPTHLILNCELPELLGAFYFRKVNLICVEHSRIPWKKRTLLGWVVRRILKLRLSKWVSVSPIIKPKIGRKFVNCTVIENPVMKLTKKTGNITKNEIKRILFIGRLSDEKNPLILLDLARDTKLSITLIGTGSLEYELKNYAMFNSVDINFLGYQINPWKEIESGDLLVIPSKSEGDCLVFLESLHTDMPVLLSDIPDFRKFQLEDRNYCGNYHEYLDRVLQYQLNSNPLIISKSHKDRILKDRSIENIADKWASYLFLSDDKIQSQTRKLR